MAKLKIKEFATKHNMNVRQVYNLIQARPHLKVKEKGLGTLIDETKYNRIVA
jgi:hypothetical protein